MEEELFTVIKHFQKQEDRILTNKNIDLYTLGLYMKLCYLAENDGNTEDLYSFGKKEYIDFALKKLEKENFIRYKDEDIEILE